jgi:hypothetical protein
MGCSIQLGLLSNDEVEVDVEDEFDGSVANIGVDTEAGLEVEALTLLL